MSLPEKILVEVPDEVPDPKQILKRVAKLVRRWPAHSVDSDSRGDRCFLLRYVYPEDQHEDQHLALVEDMCNLGFEFRPGSTHTPAIFLYKQSLADEMNMMPLPRRVHFVDSACSEAMSTDDQRVDRGVVHPQIKAKAERGAKDTGEVGQRNIESLDSAKREIASLTQRLERSERKLDRNLRYQVSHSPRLRLFSTVRSKTSTSEGLACMPECDLLSHDLRFLTVSRNCCGGICSWCRMP